jgi:hypothetical protein
MSFNIGDTVICIKNYDYFIKNNKYKIMSHYGIPTIYYDVKTKSGYFIINFDNKEMYFKKIKLITKDIKWL